MSQTHLLSDFAARIKNAQAMKQLTTKVLYSKKIEKVLNLLIKMGYIKKIETLNYKLNINMFKVYLKYESKSKKPVITEFTIVSKPGKKVFKSYKSLNKIYSGLGTIILSTSKGIIDDNTARVLKVGGEVLCNIF